MGQEGLITSGFCYKAILFLSKTNVVEYVLLTMGFGHSKIQKNSCFQVMAFFQINYMTIELR